ncbi:hypothetical protein E4U41_003151, partial [Claviceps citrina]
MGRTWSPRRPGDVMARPCPAQSPKPRDLSIFPRACQYTADAEMPKRSTGTRSLSSPSGNARSIKYGSGKHAGIEL